MRVLRSSVDTLEHTFTGELDASMVERLDAARYRAQETETPQPLWIAGVEFMVQAKSVTRYAWLLQNREMLLMLRHGDSGVTMQLKLSAYGLAHRGVEALWADALTIADELGTCAMNLVRLDLAVDFQGWEPAYDEMRHMRCRSTFRPVYPSVEAAETYMYGKGATVLRVYNKSAEIAAKHGGWWRFVWRECEGYDESLPVWRVELQLRSETLKDLSCRSVSVALEMRASVFSWGLTKWASLGAPNGDSNRWRWPEEPHWTELRAAFGESAPISRLRHVPELMGFYQAVSRYLSVLSSLGAAIESTDYAHCAEVLYDGGETALGLTDTERAEYFSGRVETKRRRALR